MAFAAATMRAARIHAYGSPDVLHYEEVPRPVPGEGETLVRVRAAGVNAIDWKIRAGHLQQAIPYTLPLTLGLDFSGSVASESPGGRDFEVGDEVYGRIDLMRLGTYADYVVARAGEFTAKPRALDHVHAAAVPLVALTAWQALIAGANGAASLNVTAGQRVLIHGGAGGVGSVAVQLAKWRGAHVIATARREDAAFVFGLGADRVLDYAHEPFEELLEPVDAVFDLVGGETQARSWDIIRPGGALATTMGEPPAEQASLREVRAIAVKTQTDLGQLGEIARLIDTFRIRIVVSDVFPLAEAARAHARVEEGHVRGKIALKMT